MKLAEEKFQAVLTFMTSKSLDKAQIARLIGIPKSTFKDALKGANLSRRTEEKINQWLNKPDNEKLVEQPRLVQRLVQRVSGLNVDLPEGMGRKPKIREAELNWILGRAGVGMEILMSEMTRLVNSDPGSREEFRKRFGKTFHDLQVLVKAMSNETTRLAVLKELGKTTLP